MVKIHKHSYSTKKISLGKIETNWTYTFKNNNNKVRWCRNKNNKNKSKKGRLSERVYSCQYTNMWAPAVQLSKSYLKNTSIFFLFIGKPVFFNWENSNRTDVYSNWTVREFNKDVIKIYLFYFFSCLDMPFFQRATATRSFAIITLHYHCVLNIVVVMYIVFAISVFFFVLFCSG